VLQSCNLFILGFFFFSGLGVGNFWGELGIRKNQNIFRKIITNNSENNYKLSYTPKPHPIHPSPSHQEIIQNPPDKTRTTPRKKVTNKKKVDSQK
jgi:hypothetical protein